MPASGLLKRNDVALIVIDMQEPFLKPIFEKERVIEKTRLLIKGAQALDAPIISTVQYAQRMGGCIPEIAELLPGGETPIDKMSFSCGGSEEFMRKLQATGRSQALVCGIEAHICVNQTVHDLIHVHAGYEVHVAVDAVSSRLAENAQQAFRRMERAGAVLTNTESALYEMLGAAGTPEFKSILALVK